MPQGRDQTVTVMKRFTKLVIIAAALAAAISQAVRAEDGYTPPHEHDFELVSHTDYTCTEDGYDTYVCRTCGKEERRVTDEASHRNELVSGHEPDCENEGNRVFVCSVCGEETVITEPALGHEWRDEGVEKAPTLFTAGSRKFVCKRDPSHVKYESIPSEMSSNPSVALPLALIACAIVLALLVATIRIIVVKRREKKKDKGFGLEAEEKGENTEKKTE